MFDIITKVVCNFLPYNYPPTQGHYQIKDLAPNETKIKQMSLFFHETFEFYLPEIHK